MADKDYDGTLRRINEVFGPKPFHFSALAIEQNRRNDILREALDALVADGLLTVLSTQPTLYQLTKHV